VPAEDNVVTGGFGAAVLEALAPHGLAGRVRTAALPDEYIGHANPADILAERGLDPEGLAATVRASLRSLGDGAVETRAEPPRPGSGL
ncbi:MAG: hypothetical protein J2P44_12055, partial [Candidatus Dormibacteraeota bacterium]|nr:hypothetical protein [Candidatus Dormibacteraeota bacterium]